MRGRMRRLTVVAFIFILVVPLFCLLFPDVKAVSELAPFIPHEVKVLLVAPADPYLSGGHYLVADLARYGFNITHHASNDAIGTDYVNDAETSNLDQYDVVIIQGILGFSTSRVSAEEVDHFTSYGGRLILIGNALFQNETSNDWWSFDSEQIQKIEQRLGVDFAGFLGEGGAWHNSGTFTLTNSSIEGLPTSLSYTTEHHGSVNYQLDLTANGAGVVYDFTITSSPSTRLVGKTTPGVTYYETENNAVGIFVQGAYIYGVASGGDIDYFGLANISERPSLLASLIAFALKRDVNTIIKPQPLATIRLDHLGGWGWNQDYLNASLLNFNSIVDAYGITPTTRFTAFPDFNPKYWQTYNPEVLSQLQGRYRHWEYSSSLQGKNTSSMTKSEIESLIQNIRDNYKSLGIDLFSTVSTANGYWSQATIEAMANENLYLINVVGDPIDLAKHYPDWWKLRIMSNVIVQNAVPMVGEFLENFTQISKDTLHYRYFSRRSKWALSVVDGFPVFAYSIANFRWNEVGTYSLQTVYQNLTSEIPDIRFVPLLEAGLYFGNKWMHIENVSRIGSVIEFDIDTSAIPTVVSIGKGMLWIRINTDEPIQEVSIDNNPWFYFDNSSIRIPASANSVHVKLILGATPSPRVAKATSKVVVTRYDNYRFNVSLSSAQGLNVSVHIFLPQVVPFVGGNWSLFSPETRWGHTFDAQSRILEFWAISDGFVTLEVGVFFRIDQTPPWYNSTVKITVDTSDLQTSVEKVILSYSTSVDWFNVTMTFGEFYVAEIPMMPYGTFVEYRIFVLDTAGHWLTTGILSYSVGDWAPPEIGIPTWDQSPDASDLVTLTVSVNEPENASGVDYVVLWYYLEDIYGLARAVSINMTQENGLWSALMPSQIGGVPVRFFVQAYDKAGNMAQTTHYRVAGGSSLPFQMILLLGIGIVAGIGIVLYFVKFRKTTRKRDKASTVKEQISNSTPDK